MDLTDDQADRLAQIIRGYRKRKRLSQQAFADRAGISIATMGRIERAESRTLTDSTIAGIEAAMEWQEDSVRLVVLGGSPIPADHPRPVITERGVLVRDDGDDLETRWYAAWQRVRDLPGAPEALLLIIERYLHNPRHGET